MRLPKLKLPMIKEGEPDNRKSITCLGKDHCSTCVLYTSNGGRCEGCTIKHKGDVRSRGQDRRHCVVSYLVKRCQPEQ